MAEAGKPQAIESMDTAIDLMKQAAMHLDVAAKNLRGEFGVPAHLLGVKEIAKKLRVWSEEIKGLQRGL